MRFFERGNEPSDFINAGNFLCLAESLSTVQERYCSIQ